MGSKELPFANGERHARTFERLGWRRSRQKGSHIILIKSGVHHHLCIPNHPGSDVKRGLLAKQLKLAGVTVDEYLKAFR